MKYTDHAKERLQQRGAKKEVIEFVFQNGKSIKHFRKIKNLQLNAKQYFINKKTLNNLKYKNIDFVKKYEKDILNTIVVACPKGELLITVTRANKRIQWN
jgi:hypothetical protein